MFDCIFDSVKHCFITSKAITWIWVHLVRKDLSIRCYTVYSIVLSYIFISIISSKDSCYMHTMWIMIVRTIVIFFDSDFATIIIVKGVRNFITQPKVLVSSLQVLFFVSHKRLSIIINSHSLVSIISSSIYVCNYHTPTIKLHYHVFVDSF